MSGARVQKQVEMWELVEEGLRSSARGVLSPATPGQEAQQRQQPGWVRALLSPSCQQIPGAGDPQQSPRGAAQAADVQQEEVGISRSPLFPAGAGSLRHQGLSLVSWISQARPTLMLCPQGCAGGPEQPSDFEPNSGGASCHRQPQSRGSCERVFTLLLLGCSWAPLFLRPSAQPRLPAVRPPRLRTQQDCPRPSATSHPSSC